MLVCVALKIEKHKTEDNIVKVAY